MKKGVLKFFAIAALLSVIAGCVGSSGGSFIGDSSSLTRNWTIYLIHHTHLDIGYTHPQQEVLEIQWRHLEKAMDLIEATSSNPEGERFVWNPEGMWGVEKWLEQASAENRARFIKHVQAGSIGLSGFYASLHTYYPRPAELMAMCSAGRELADITGVNIRNAMITDVPGWSWGLVETMAKNGIRYFSAGPNEFDRIGNIFEARGDRPFWWVSPSGKEKVLVFVHGKGYSWAHEWGTEKYKGPDVYPFPTRHVSGDDTSKWFLSYLDSLEKSDYYPYDILPMRYNVGADNGPPDEYITQRISRWNRANPKVQIKLVTVDQAMEAFEKKYGDLLPEYQGDFSGYWEDGAMSTAREVGIVRDAAEQIERLYQTSAISKQSDDFLKKSYKTQKEIILFDEHTWGAHNSIWQPDLEFVKSQWAWKRQRALDSADFSSQMVKSKVAELSAPVDGSLSFFNPHSWSLSEVFYIPAEKAGDYISVEDLSGQLLPSQKLSDGRIAFFSEIPPFGQLSVRLSSLKFQGEAIAHSEVRLSNSKLDIVFHKKKGVISSIKDKASGKEFVNQLNSDGFNRYIYVKGLHGKLGKRTKTGRVSFEIVDNGPVVATIRVKSCPAGSIRLISEITLEQDSPFFKVKNIVDRPQIRTKEAILFAFPFNMENSKLYYDVAFGRVNIEKEMLDGGCRSYVTPNRYFELSGNGSQVTAVLVDAPMIQPFDINTDEKVRGYPKKFKANNGLVYSYVMNNYWHTNFKADQPGVTSFRYLFKFGAQGEVQDSARFAASQMQKPILLEGRKGQSLVHDVSAWLDHPQVAVKFYPDGKELALYLQNDSNSVVKHAGLELAPYELKKIKVLD
ncbi:MAG: hypothetical protein JXR63_00260 [Spirochaetales bacterium]|nr:hypothetical protein [Spirochaetales bacterium]